jgi:N-acetylmuramoyl-L-alanine amidase
MRCGNCGAQVDDVPRAGLPASVARIEAGGCPECLAFGPDRYFDTRGRELERGTWRPIGRWRQMWRSVASARVPGAYGASALAGLQGAGTMHIENGMLKGPGVKWRKAHAFGGDMKAARFAVIHDTAGRLDPFSSVNWFASKECKTSAHFVVERDGTITQMVPTNKRAYHAGVSTWKGVSGLNSCSVGIEIVNPGKMDEKGKAWFGDCCKPGEITKKGTSQHGQGCWLPYTEAQIKSVTAICRALVEEYPDCNEILTHWEIAPRRKIDTNPLFPLEELRRVVFDPTPGEVEHLPEPAPPPPPPVREPTVAAEAAKSKSVWLLLSIAAGKVGDFFLGLGDKVSDGLDSVVEVLGPAQKEAETTIAPLMSLTKTLQVNVGKIALWGTIVVLVVVIARHIKDKVELARVKQQLPDQPNETAAESTR